ncbi:MAG TPA: TMEM165/GDT1 family protein [Allosphingosinicella sp.]|jgi:putative Ca2+/H+ antiporter (TMEM165/GDT1 family)
MEALLFSFVAAALAGWGERTQLLTALVSGRSGRPLTVLLGWTIAALAICAVAGVGGAMLHAEITARALALLVALSLAFAGIMGLFEPPPPGWAARFKGGPFLTSLIFGFVFSSGGRTQLMTFALAAQSPTPWLAAAGGAAGMIVASVPAALLGKEFLDWRLRPVRIGIAALFLVAGTIVGLAAIQPR